MRRKRPRNQYVVERRRVGLDPYPSEPDGSVWQLHLLQEEAAREETDAFAVLSIGGNDARAAFASSLDLDTIVETMTRRGIVEAYTQLASDVAKLSAGLILVLVYHPRVTPVPLLWLLPPQPDEVQVLCSPPGQEEYFPDVKSGRERRAGAGRFAEDPRTAPGALGSTTPIVSTF